MPYSVLGTFPVTRIWFPLQAMPALVPPCRPLLRSPLTVGMQVFNCGYTDLRLQTGRGPSEPKAEHRFLEF